MRKKQTKAELLARADKIEKALKSGKVKGEKRRKAARYAMYSLRFRAKQFNGSRKTIRKSKAAVEQNDQLSLDKTFIHEAFQRRLSRRIDDLVDKAVANLLEAAKTKVG
jgi:hypothetical protein